MEAQKWLEQLGKLDQLIDAKVAEHSRLRALAADISPKPLDGMPYNNTGMVSRKLENAVINLVMLGDEIDKLIDKYVDYKQEVVKALEKLSANEYGVLHRYYVRYMTLEQIAEDMGYCERQISRIKKKALKNLEDVLECHAIR